MTQGTTQRWACAARSLLSQATFTIWVMALAFAADALACPDAGTQAHINNLRNQLNGP